MIVKMICSPAAARGLAARFGLTTVETAEAEFREVPYFLVTRSAKTWNFGRGDINSVLALSATDDGLLVDPDSDPDVPKRKTLIPWHNIISLTVPAVPSADGTSGDPTRTG